MRHFDILRDREESEDAMISDLIPIQIKIAGILLKYSLLQGSRMLRHVFL